MLCECVRGCQSPFFISTVDQSSPSFPQSSVSQPSPLAADAVFFGLWLVEDLLAPMLLDFAFGDDVTWLLVLADGVGAVFQSSCPPHESQLSSAALAVAP